MHPYNPHPLDTLCNLNAHPMFLTCTLGSPSHCMDPLCACTPSTVPSASLIKIVVGPPLSVDSLMAVLEGVAGKWRSLGSELYVPARAIDVIASESTSDSQCLRGTLRYWIRHDPHASWRRLIWRLDWSEDADLRRLSDDIRRYAEKLTG